MALQWSLHLGRRRAFRVFNGSGQGRARDGAAEEGIDLGEISDAIVGHNEVGLKLGYSGSEGEDLVLNCPWLRFTGGPGRAMGIFLKPVFR